MSERRIRTEGHRKFDWLRLFDKALRNGVIPGTRRRECSASTRVESEAGCGRQARRVPPIHGHCPCHTILLFHPLSLTRGECPLN